MSQPFPATPANQDFLTPSRVECEIHDLPVIGQLPAALEGMFFRVGPDPQYPRRNGEDDPFINGDGMVSVFHFKNGKVSFRNRFVRTERFQREYDAGGRLFGDYRNPYTDDPSVAGLSRGTANTSLLWHGGRLFALKEDSRPVEIDPITLATLGEWDFEGALTSRTMTAHPKVDPVTGELLIYGSAAKGEASPDIALYWINADGQVTREEWLMPPYASMMHDFAVTEDYIILLVMPTTSNDERLKRGGPIFVWDESQDTYLAVLSRKTQSESVRWFRGPARWAFHVMNAYNKGSFIYIDLCAAREQPFPYFPNIDGSPRDKEKATPQLLRWTLDLASDEEAFSEHMIFSQFCEVPVIDDRFALHFYTQGFLGVNDFSRHISNNEAEMGFVFNTIMRIDVETGETDSYFVGEGYAAQEPTFVPLPGATKEAEGYLLSVLNNYRTQRSELAIFDAHDLKKGPIARLLMPLALRNGIHGCWIAEEHFLSAK
ncbi:carotenoid oxygenase family protein [Halomonas sp. WWR20]